jgi:hypothetical protein
MCPKRVLKLPRKSGDDAKAFQVSSTLTLTRLDISAQVYSALNRKHPDIDQHAAYLVQAAHSTRIRHSCGKTANSLLA